MGRQSHVQRREAARAAGLKLLNLSGPGMTEGLNRIEHHASLLPHCARTGVGLLFKMLNSHDHPDYQAAHGCYGFSLLEKVGSPAVKLLYDVYRTHLYAGDQECRCAGSHGESVEIGRLEKGKPTANIHKQRDPLPDAL